MPCDGGGLVALGEGGDVMASGRSSQKLGELPMPAACVRSRDDGRRAQLSQMVEDDLGAWMQGGSRGSAGRVGLRLVGGLRCVVDEVKGREMASKRPRAAISPRVQVLPSPAPRPWVCADGRGKRARACRIDPVEGREARGRIWRWQATRTTPWFQIADAPPRHDFLCGLMKGGGLIDHQSQSSWDLYQRTAEWFFVCDRRNQK